jgi:flavin reductase (DIM6/NTAB) family NADH-FMN oxidoreductase RutF
VDRKAFTVNIPSEKFVKEADYIGTVSGRDFDKFSKTGLTAIKSEFVDAPYVEEFSLVLECKIIHVVEIGLHTEFIGEILDVKADESVLSNDGSPDIEKVRPIIFSPGSRVYYGIGKKLGKAFSIGKK